MSLLRMTIALAAFSSMAVTAGSADLDVKPTPIQSELKYRIAALSGVHFDGSESPAVDNETFETTRVTKRKVSIAKAAALSALLPGLGEYYAGNRAKAKYFFAGEAVTWISFFAFRTYGAWKKDDLIDFADQAAKAELDGKSDEFLDWVGFYRSIYEFNSLGRVSDQYRPYLEDTPENHWLWQSEEDQEIYRSLKNSSREAYRRSNFMIGVAIVHRIISVIDAIRDAKRAGRGLDDEFSASPGFRYQLVIDPLDREQQITFTVFAPF